MSGTGWAWSFFPRRLRTDEGFLGLSREDRGVLRELYDAADKWGRGPGDRMALMQALATLDGFDAAPALQRLASAGFVRLWTVEGRKVWELVNWESDAPGELIRKRKGRSDYLDEPAGSPSGPRPRTADTVRPPSGRHPDDVPPASAHHPDGVRPPSGQRPEETRRDETRRDEVPASGDRAPAHAHARAPLDPRAVAARDRWLAHLRVASPLVCLADDTVDSVAVDFPAEVFVRGVEKHLGDDGRWWRRHPLGALRKRCEWAAEQGPARPPGPAPAAPPPPPKPDDLRRSLVVKVATGKLRAYAQGTASPEVRAEVEAAPLLVCEAGDQRGRERPFREWPPDIRAEAIAHLRPGAAA